MAFLIIFVMYLNLKYMNLTITTNKNIMYEKIITLHQVHYTSSKEWTDLINFLNQNDYANFILDEHVIRIFKLCRNTFKFMFDDQILYINFVYNNRCNDEFVKRCITQNNKRLSVEITTTFWSPIGVMSQILKIDNSVTYYNPEENVQHIKQLNTVWDYFDVAKKRNILSKNESKFERLRWEYRSTTVDMNVEKMRIIESKRESIERYKQSIEQSKQSIIKLEKEIEKLLITFDQQ